MKIVSIVGARPQFVKAAPVSKALRRRHHEFLVHTGQHYDEEMSQIFFDELEIPRPDMNLGVGSGSHARQTADMLVGIEKIINQQQPDIVFIYGDTNSTLAGAIAASKLQVCVAHVEAGLRSYNRMMPEEINRIMADKISTFLFCPTKSAVGNLGREGIIDGVYHTGDVMIDALLQFSELAQKRSAIMDKLNLKDKDYILLTLHRAQNTDSSANMTNIVNALVHCKKNIIFPVHPRTKKYLDEYGLMGKLSDAGNLRLIAPISYLDMIMLEKHAEKIVTDSGGVQKEAYFFKVPCITMRGETEWVETVQDGWNILVGADYESIVMAIRDFNPSTEQHQHYGDGTASHNICSILEKEIKS
ncbi:MAG: UDP-N-acetylglucosamine 2-epimerase (non-hydrolyzing) [Candidatus Thermoplasmatota archaeon]|nr:UDP-N-acetylglucosamine 2-epimerase (non-hydrolyzing) [Candidatus Thermoplasmatota archaeon]